MTDFSVLPRLTEQMITTAAPTIAISAILITVRPSGGATRPRRRRAAERSHMAVPVATISTARIIQPTTGAISP